MPQFFISNKNVEDTRVFVTDRQDIKHIRDVLRLNSGDQLTLIDESENLYTVKIVGISKENIETTIINKEKSRKKLGINLTLAQSLLKSSAQDIVIQKATELGVKEIIPILTRYTVVKLNSDKDKNQKLERFQKIAYESCKQCERADIPVINKISTLKDVITGGYDIILTCVERNAKQNIKQFLKEQRTNLKPESRILIIIGPEGGWSDEELKFFEENKVGQVSLGNLILRAETACITAISDVIYEYELE